MKTTITSITTVHINIEDGEAFAAWRSLYTKLHNYFQAIKPMDDIYKTTAVGYARKLELTNEEMDLIEFVYENIKTSEE